MASSLELIILMIAASGVGFVAGILYMVRFEQREIVKAKYRRIIRKNQQAGA